MNPINFDNNQWHIQSTREIVEVRLVQEVPERFQVFVRGQAVTNALPREHPLVALASLIEYRLPGELLFVASQTAQHLAQQVQQQQQQANQAAPGVVAEIVEALGDAPNLG